MQNLIFEEDKEPNCLSYGEIIRGKFFIPDNDLDNFYTVEFKSDTVDGLRKLETILNLKDVIRGPIASHMKELINKNNN